MGLPASAGDELAFFMNRVLGQSNRASLGLSHILTGDCQRCVLFNYRIDLPWMMDSFPQLQTYPRVEVVTVRDPAEPRLDYPNVRFYSPPLPVQYGVHHSKMLLLFYSTGVRVAIVTANFISIDWIWKNNVAYVQDFPRKNQYSPRSSMFEEDLRDYLKPYARVGLALDDNIAEFDFSGATAMLIPSIPGRHRGDAIRRYGHMRLRHLLSREPLPRKFDHAPIVAQFSSIGSVSESWLMGELRTSLAAHASGDSSFAPRSADLPPLKLIWPTVESVRTSLEGWIAGRSLCCDSKNQKSFFRSHLHVFDGDAQNRGRAAPHIKSYTRASPDGELAWCLLTSANCSNSAWGQLQLNGSQLQIRHYELGCLFTPSHYARALAVLKQRGLASFTCTPEQRMPTGERGMSAFFQEKGGHEYPASTTRVAAASSSPSPPLPVVRLVLPPPTISYQAGIKRKATPTPHEHEIGREPHAAAASSSSAHAKRSRSSDVALSPPINSHSATVPMPITAVGGAAGGDQVGVTVTVICPLPHNVINPKPYDDRGPREQESERMGDPMSHAPHPHVCLPHSPLS